MTLIKSISGIRGTIGGVPGENLTPIDTVKFAAAFGTWIVENKGLKKVVIGRDARPSGNLLSSIVTNTLVSLGIDVVDLGLSTTPTVEIAVVEEEAGGGIILTASHNPAEWNALKLLNNSGEFISDEEGRRILDIAESEDFSFSPYYELGTITQNDSCLDLHIKQILDLDLVDVKAIASRGFKIAVDGINSSGGIAVPSLLKALGVEVVKTINPETTGLFAHNPEPLPAHMAEIMEVVGQGDFDLGIVVDPDVDRLAFICEDGSPFGEEYTLVAVAEYILNHKPGNTVSNLSSTQALRIITESTGNTYLPASVGEVNVVDKMKEINAVIGGEGNGGIIYPELHYGRDALVGIALFLTHLANEKITVSEMRKTFPNFTISKNKIELNETIDVGEILKSMENKYLGNPVNTEDGVKIEFPNLSDPAKSEWIHLRKSNTEPIIRIYAESGSEQAADKLAQRAIDEIKEIVETNE